METHNSISLNRRGNRIIAQAGPMMGEGLTISEALRNFLNVLERATDKRQREIFAAELWGEEQTQKQAG
jgi:hypothetical protein